MNLSLDIQNVNIDFNQILNYPIPSVKGDTGREIQFAIFNNGIPVDLTGEQVKVFGIKPDNYRIFANLEIIDEANGICSLKLTPQMLCVAGIVRCTLVRYAGGLRLSSRKFNIEVAESVADDIEIESTSEYKGLTDLISTVDNFKSIQQQIDNLVLGAVGDGNNPEIIQARDTETVLNNRISKIEDGSRINELSINKLMKDDINCIEYDKIMFNKYIIGYDTSTLQPKFGDKAGACVYEIQVTPYVGTIKIPLTTITSGQAMLVKSNGNVIRNYTIDTLKQYCTNFGTLESEILSINVIEFYRFIKTLTGKDVTSILYCYSMDNIYMYRTNGYLLSKNHNIMSEFALSSYPFTKNSNFIKENRCYKSVANAIKDICLYVTNENDTYYIRAVNIHDNMVDVHIGSKSTMNNVCNVVNIEIEEGLQKLNVTPKLDSGCTGYIVLDSSLIDTNISYFGFYTLNPENSEILPACIHKKVDETSIFVTPPLVYAVADTEMTVYLDNIFYNKPEEYLIKKISGTGMLTSTNKIRYNTPNSQVGTTVLDVLNKERELLGTLNIPFKISSKNANSGVTKKIMVIGDSFVASGGISGGLRTLFENDVMNVTLLGTLGSGTNRHEGRSGWSSYDIIKTSSYNNSTNAFLNSSGDFDFAYYLSNNSIDTPDIVFIQFGINDLWRPMNNTTTVDNINTMITSIKATNSNVIIGVGLVCPPYLGDAEGEYTKLKHVERLDLLKEMIAGFSTRKSEKIYPIAINTNLDTKNNFTITTKANVANSDRTIEICNDVTHPTNGGYSQIANVYYAFLKSL